MRIISGWARGMNLRAPRGTAVRPTGDRVKEAIFTTLGSLEGAVVFDLFAGSGALGLEALSRGAQHVVWVEQKPRHAAVIRQNLSQVKKALPAEDLMPGCEIKLGNALLTPRRHASWRGHIDIIFADPPYHPGPGGCGPVEVIESKELADWAEGAIMVLEHAGDLPLPLHECPWDVLKHKTYGDTVVMYLKPKHGSEG